MSQQIPARFAGGAVDLSHLASRGQQPQGQSGAQVGGGGQGFGENLPVRQNERGNLGQGIEAGEDRGPLVVVLPLQLVELVGNIGVAEESLRDHRTAAFGAEENVGLHDRQPTPGGAPLQFDCFPRWIGGS